MLNKQTGNRNK